MTFLELILNERIYKYTITPQCCFVYLFTTDLPEKCFVVPSSPSIFLRFSFPFLSFLNLPYLYWPVVVIVNTIGYESDRKKGSVKKSCKCVCQWLFRCVKCVPWSLAVGLFLTNSFMYLFINSCLMPNLHSSFVLKTQSWFITYLSIVEDRLCYYCDHFSSQ